MDFAKHDNIKILQALKRPDKKVKVLIDTDTYNEIDDQYAVAYAMRSGDKMEVVSICAAPFYNGRSESPADGMEKSYNEIFNILKLAGVDDMNGKVHRGSTAYLPDADTPVESDAARNIVESALSMPEGERLYIIALGAITNVASAILINPSVVDKVVVLWLGGNALHWKNNREFNCCQDVHGAKVLFDSGAPVVQFPCSGVVDRLLVTEPELKYWLDGQNELCRYLCEITCDYSKEYSHGCAAWSKVIWDIAPVAWLAGSDNWMDECIVHSPVATLEHTYSSDLSRHFIKYIREINRDLVFEDLFNKLRIGD